MKLSLLAPAFFLLFVFFALHSSPMARISTVPSARAAAVSYDLPVPNPQPSTAGPAGWVSNLYQFSLMVAGLLAFGVIAWAGLKLTFAAGNPSAQSDARDQILQALLGLLLLMGAYVILYTINPGLVNLPTDLGIKALQEVAGGSAVSPVPGAKCQSPATGPCNSTQLQGGCFSDPQIAAGVCNVESSGNPNAQGDKCDDGSFASIGLFQINLSANTIKDPATGQTLNCPKAFSNAYTGSNPHCTITDQNLYQQCAAAAKNPSTNIEKACALSKNGTNWNLWGPATKRACGL